MTDELAPEGLELQPDSMDGFGTEEAGSEEAYHFLPPIRELPADREFVEGAFYSMRLADGTPGENPVQLGEKLGQGLFQALTDVHLFGRNSDGEPWLEVGPVSPEPVQMLIGQELFPASGEALAEDDLGMFSMVAGRVAKTLGRDKTEAEEDTASAAARSNTLAGLKGTLSDTFSIGITGDLDLAKVLDAALSLGMKRGAKGVGWMAGQAVGDPLFLVSAEGSDLAAGCTGNTSKVSLTFTVAAVTQPNKVAERMFTAANYMQGKCGGEIVGADGNPASDDLARGQDAKLDSAIERITAAGLTPGHVVTKRLV
ncbi:MAG: hypothetical protein V3V10_10540 [Planctomycetota bacterium]